MDDPRNEAEKGSIRLVAGKHEDGYSYSVVADDGFVDVECETIEVIGPAEYPMGKREVERWAADQDEAKEAAKND